MAAPYVSETAQVDVIFLLDNQRVENVLHFRQTGGWITSELEALCILVREWVVGAYLSPLSTALSFIQVSAKDLGHVGGETFDLAITPVLAGGNNSGPMTNETALCVSKRTGSSGRSFRGRVYVPGIPRDAVVQNTVTNAFRSAMLGAFETLLSDVSEQPYELVLVSRKSGGVVRPEPLTQAVTSFILTDNTIDSQRRRKPGNGQ